MYPILSYKASFPQKYKNIAIKKNTNNHQLEYYMKLELLIIQKQSIEKQNSMMQYHEEKLKWSSPFQSIMNNDQGLEII